MVAALLLLALLLLALLRPISSHPFTLAALLRARSPRCAAPRLASRVTYLAVARSASTSLRHAVLRYHKHHDHDCTLADMARVADASGRPVGLVLVVLRPPASRVMSGLLRRMESSDTVRQNAMATKAYNRLWRDSFGSRGPNASNLFVDALRDEAHPEHDAAIRTVEGPNQQNYMLPVSEFYLAAAPAHVSGGSASSGGGASGGALHAVQRRGGASVSASPPPPPRLPPVAFLCMERLDDDLRRLGARHGLELAPPTGLLHAHTSTAEARALLPFTDVNRAWLEEVYAADVRLHRTHCGGGGSGVGGGGSSAGSGGGASLPPPRPSSQPSHLAPTSRAEATAATAAATPMTAGPQFASGDVGVLLSVAGSARFVSQEVLPAVAYYRNSLGLPDAAERRKRRSAAAATTSLSSSSSSSSSSLASSSSSSEAPRGGVAWAAGAAELRWALVTDVALLPPLAPALPFFDVVRNVSADVVVGGSGVSKGDGGGGSSRGVGGGGSLGGAGGDGSYSSTAALMHRAKSFKTWALLHAPFRVTIFLDFDTRPCVPGFGAKLAATLFSSSSSSSSLPQAPAAAAGGFFSHALRRAGGGPDGGGGGDPDSWADLAITNKYPSQQRHAPSSPSHWHEEHNSACLVLHTASTRTRALLRAYRSAFLAARPPPIRDQPSLRAALASLALGSSSGTGGGARGTGGGGGGGGGGIRHVDLDVVAPRFLCRRKVSADVSCEAGCLLVHKPQKHDMGAKVRRGTHPCIHSSISIAQEDTSSAFARSVGRRCPSRRPPSRHSAASPHSPSRQVVGIGFKKTGLTTLSAVLAALQIRPPKGDSAKKGALVDAILRNASDVGPSLEAAAKSRALVDGPWALPASALYRRVATRWPSARFVLTVRARTATMQGHTETHSRSLTIARTRRRGPFHISARRCARQRAGGHRSATGWRAPSRGTSAVTRRCSARAHPLAPRGSRRTRRTTRRW